MHNNRPLEALQLLHTMQGPLRHFWVPPGVVQQLRSQVPAAAAALGQDQLSVLQLVHHMCLLAPDPQQPQHPEPLSDLGDKLTRCCLSDPAMWPADPMQYSVSLPGRIKCHSVAVPLAAAAGGRCCCQGVVPNVCEPVSPAPVLSFFTGQPLAIRCRTLQPAY